MNTSQNPQNKLEQTLDEVFVTKSPVQLPEKARATLVQFMPWLTLIGGVLMLFAAWGTYQLLTFAYNLGMYVSPYYASAAPMNALGWVSLAILVVQAVMMFIAFPALKERKKKGWNMLLWVSLLNVVGNVVYFIAYMNIGSLIFSLLGSALGLFILFQIRSHYLGAAAKPVSKPAAPVSTTPPADRPKKTS